MPTHTIAQPTLSEQDLCEIEAQVDDTVPTYVHALIRDLRLARELLAQLVEARR